MIRKFWLRGSVALAFLLGTLVLSGPTHAAVESCDSYQPGTQAWASCVLRAENPEPAPTTPVDETSSTEVWQLAAAGVGGALVAIGTTMAMVRLGQRQRVAAH